MSLQCIIGGGGSGKTQYCYQSILSKVENNQGNSLLYIVPEQFTLQTQKELVSRSARKGIMQIEVLSFQRLAYRVFEEIGNPSKKILGDMGKSMVLRKVTEEQKDELQYFQKMISKKGFIDELKRMITEFYQYDVGQEQLRLLLYSLQNHPILETKLKDLQKIFHWYQSYIAEQYISTEETIDLLTKKLYDSIFLETAEVWVDGFYGFTPQQYGLLRALMKKVRKLYITIPMASRYSHEKSCDESDLFYESWKTYNRILKISTEEEIDLEEAVLLKNYPRFQENMELEHLADNLFHYPYKRYNEKTQRIEVLYESKRSDEVEETACKILSLVRDEGYRFQDIAIITSGLEAYDKKIQRIFEMYTIPYFIDEKKDILANPFVVFLQSILAIQYQHWSYESVFRYVKTGLGSLTREQGDELENYVLSNGIWGGKVWTQEGWKISEQEYPDDLKRKEMESQFQRILAARDQIAAPLMEFKNSLNKSGTLTVRSITEALYEFLERMDIPKKIDDRIQDFKEKKEFLLEREYAQVWKMVMDLFDKMVEILGNEEVSIQKYAQILDAGLEQCKMGLVPPGLDQVMIGDLERTRLQGIKVLFMIGMNDGILPRNLESTGILTERERLEMEAFGVELASSPKKKVYEEQFLIYSAITRPSDKLYLSYALMDDQGKALRQSVILHWIEKIFPNIMVREKEMDKCTTERVSAPSPAYNIMIQNIRRWIKDENSVWKDVYSWFYVNWKEKTKFGIRGFIHNNQEDRLENQYLFPPSVHKIKSSVTRLENYTVCPFSYFLKYGLQAKEREFYEVTYPDVGLVYHMVLDEVGKKVIASDQDWFSLPKEELREMVERAVEEIIPNIHNSIFMHSHRNQYFAKRLKRIAQQAVDILQHHIQQGNFLPYDFEVGFGSGERIPGLIIEIEKGKILELTGRIDRIDLLECEEGTYVKVIDYKSGSRSFDISEIFNGLQIQLIIYLDAILNHGKELFGKQFTPAGMFYFYIQDPTLSGESDFTPEEIQKLWVKQFKMSGLVLSDEEIIRNLDKEIDGHSNIIPVRFTKSGVSQKISSIATEEQFEVLRQYVENKIKEIGKELIHGNISITPIQTDQWKACDRCRFGSICQFDETMPENSFKRILKVGKEEIWDTMKQKVEEDKE